MEFPNSSDQKRYHSLFHYNKTVYGGRVYKASLDAGCTCPNRDGSRGMGGCTFCQGGSHYFAGTGEIVAQLEAERQRIHRKNPMCSLFVNARNRIVFPIQAKYRMNFIAVMIRLFHSHDRTHWTDTAQQFFHALLFFF